jgi:hypothetical protein
LTLQPAEELMSLTAVSKQWSAKMSEDGQWRQLGSIVNAVLGDTRTKAIRNGVISRKMPGSIPEKGQIHTTSSQKSIGNGFLRAVAPTVATGPQLELPVGIAGTQVALARAPRGARLM